MGTCQNSNNTYTLPENFEKISQEEKQCLTKHFTLMNYVSKKKRLKTACRCLLDNISKNMYHWHSFQHFPSLLISLTFTLNWLRVGIMRNKRTNTHTVYYILFDNNFGGISMVNSTKVFELNGRIQLHRQSALGQKKTWILSTKHHSTQHIERNSFSYKTVYPVK